MPDTESPNAPTAAAGVSINGGVGVGVGEGSSVPVKKPVVSVEVVSIIESVCNATGQWHTDISSLFSRDGGKMFWVEVKMVHMIDSAINHL